MKGQAEEARDIPVKVHVSDHARDRARQRSPGFKAARIVDEVRLALREGRVSPNKPEGFLGLDYPDCLYVWNDQRAYAIKAVDNGFVVTTTVVLRKGAA
jgi:hypothetical protein